MKQNINKESRFIELIWFILCFSRPSGTGSWFLFTQNELISRGLFCLVILGRKVILLLVHVLVKNRPMFKKKIFGSIGIMEIFRKKFFFQRLRGFKVIFCRILFFSWKTVQNFLLNFHFYSIMTCTIFWGKIVFHDKKEFDEKSFKTL